MSGFTQEVSSFVRNHTPLCVCTLGVAIVIYALGNLAGRTVCCIRGCIKNQPTISKTDSVGSQIIAEATGTPLAATRRAELAIPKLEKDEQEGLVKLGFTWGGHVKPDSLISDGDSSYSKVTLPMGWTVHKATHDPYDENQTWKFIDQTGENRVEILLFPRNQPSVIFL